MVRLFFILSFHILYFHASTLSSLDRKFKILLFQIWAELVLKKNLNWSFFLFLLWFQSLAGCEDFFLLCLWKTKQKSNSRVYFFVCVGVWACACMCVCCFLFCYTSDQVNPEKCKGLRLYWLITLWTYTPWFHKLKSVF